MNWEATGALAEMIGAGAVIGSIVYLASQIRQNTLSNRINAMQNTTDQYASFCNMMLLNDDIRDIWNRGRRAIEDLSENERGKFYYINLSLSYYYSSQHFQSRVGALDEIEWAQSLSLIRNSWLAYPGVRTWWRDDLDKTRLTKPFYELIEAQLKELEAIDREGAAAEPVPG